MSVGNGFGVSVSRPLQSGIYAPIPTFFLADSEDLDIPAFKAHVVRLASVGVAPVIAGSTGEAIHLSHLERVTLIQSARQALDAAGHLHVPIIAGAGAGSTRETIQLCKEAADDGGADYVIVIASGYFAGALNRKALKDFWKEVSEKSPIPVMIYNFPGASGGIDLDSDLITELAVGCPNICGVKLTCGNVGKLTRIADTVSRPSFVSTHAPFLVLGGYADFIVPSAFANANGAITGLANVAPHSIRKLFDLSGLSMKDLSILPEMQQLQGIIARADFTISKTSIAGTKFLMEKMYGYGGLPRKPLPPMEPDAAQALWEHPHTQDLVRTERQLSGKIMIQ